MLFIFMVMTMKVNRFTLVGPIKVYICINGFIFVTGML